MRIIFYKIGGKFNDPKAEQCCELLTECYEQRFKDANVGKFLRWLEENMPCKIISDSSTGILYIEEIVVDEKDYLFFVLKNSEMLR